MSLIGKPFPPGVPSCENAIRSMAAMAWFFENYENLDNNPETPTESDPQDSHCSILSTSINASGMRFVVWVCERRSGGSIAATAAAEQQKDKPNRKRRGGGARQLLMSCAIHTGRVGYVSTEEPKMSAPRLCQDGKKRVIMLAVGCWDLLFTDGES
jgi:hypothetical protein